MNRLYGAVAAGIAAFLLVAAAPDLTTALSTDQKNAADSPLTGRYKGAALILQTHKAFDDLSLPSGPEAGEDYDSSKHFSATVRAQGEVTRSIYISPPGRSVLEVTKNYSDALASHGFKTVYDCAAAACGPAFRQLKYSWNLPATHVVGVDLNEARRALVQAVFDAGRDIRYHLLEKNGAYVALFGALNAGGGFGDASAALNDRVSLLVEVVQPRAMDRNIVVLDASAIGQALMADGAVSFYGLYFDTDKASLQPASKPQLDQMAGYLKAHPDVLVYVVGHTDNQGSLDHNMSLAVARARSVAAALSGSYGVAASRLAARGVGPLAPAASNATDAGRARNRRVQMVLQ